MTSSISYHLWQLALTKSNNADFFRFLLPTMNVQRAIPWNETEMYHLISRYSSHKLQKGERRNVTSQKNFSNWKTCLLFCVCLLNNKSASILMVRLKRLAFNLLPFNILSSVQYRVRVEWAETSYGFWNSTEFGSFADLYLLCKLPPLCWYCVILM